MLQEQAMETDAAPAPAYSHSGRSSLSKALRFAALSLLLACIQANSAFLAGQGQAPSRARGNLAVRTATLERKKQSSPPAASEWRLGVGHAIDVLRHDVKGIFDVSRQHVPDFSIYHPDIEVVDARLPSFQLRGLANYQKVLSTLQWSLKAACTRSQLDITSVSPPVNSELYMRWRLKLWVKDLRSLLASAWGATPSQVLSSSLGGPVVLEGYSRYTFDQWSAEIVKITSELTNPPMYLADLFSQYARVPSWPMPVHSGVAMPGMHFSTLGLSGRTVSKEELAVSSGSITATRAWPREPTDIGTLAGSTAHRSGQLPQRLTGSRVAALAGWLPGMPETCEDDFECNDGKANFPLQCCELPVMGKFCCEPPDDIEQNGGIRMPAWVPIPVPVREAPWEGQGRGGRN
eukprot:TRINITY_DN59118_c0_g1_i1.p1 TRINITY_DN59118_c0_g1~~TRINITY_DN59118_c0_g1_i1.p1  ORF type:complete len:405 (-),score=63.10 TRINITY_DN59118_c0_g1_i1:441-1655(-)